MVRHFASLSLAFAAALGSGASYGADPPKASPQAPAPAPAPKLVPPRPLVALEAGYPDGLPANEQQETDVVLEITVTVEGGVKEARVVKGDEPYAGQATRAAAQWRFDPATRDGKPISARIRVLVHFVPPKVEEVPPEAEQGPAGAQNAGQNAPAKPKAVVAPIEVIAIGEKKAPGTVTLGRAEVRVLPGAFGDPFRAIEALPGVTPILSGVPFFYIRGAPPGNVGYFLDNIRVPYLYHLALGPSVVNPALVDRVDLYPGGYPAQYGRFAGGIVAGETTKPKAEFRGEGNLRTFDVGALVEAPLGSRGSVLAGGRYSYTAAMLSLFAPGTTLDYWDYQARVSYDITPSQHLTLFAFGGYDYLGQEDDNGVEQTVFNAQFHRVDLRYDVEVGSRTRLRQAVTFGYDRTALGGQGGVYARNFLFAARSQILHRVNESVLIRAGVDANLDSYDIFAPDDENAQNLFDVLFPPRQDIAAGVYADAVIETGRGVEFTPGARVDWFGSRGATAMSADVRLGMRVPVTKKVRLLSAMGLAHQPPSFVLPVPGLAIGELSGGLQTAAQSSTGVEVDLPLGFKASGTFFLNGFFNMNDTLGTADRDGPPQNPGGPPGMGPGPGGPPGMGPGMDEPRPNEPGPAVLNERALGNAIGLEIYIRRKLTERLGGFVSYTLSRSTRKIGNRTTVASFDRTHVLNGAISFDAGRGWRLGTRVVFYTGLPVEEDVQEQWGSDRLDPFFRIDARVEKRWKMKNKRWLSLVAEMLNVTLNEEPTGLGCTPDGCKQSYIGPVSVPSIGLEGGF
ncbi:MAG: TonB family protein [Polyangiaceae bacterium]|nr:TonB family protein [Polyangiaceae bacterium]